MVKRDPIKRDPIYRWTGVFRIGKSGEPLTNMIQYSVGCSMSMSIFILYCLYFLVGGLEHF